MGGPDESRAPSLARLASLGDSVLRDALELHPDACTLSRAVRDADGRPVDMTLLWMNAAARAGRADAEAAIGRRCSELFPEMVASGWLAACLRVLASGAAEEADFEWTNAATARAAHFEWRGTRLEGDLLLCVLRDTSDRTRRLRQTEARMAAILDTAPDMIVTLDERGVILSTNAACEDLFGWRPDELVGRNVGVLMSPDEERVHVAAVERYLATGVARVIGRGRDVKARRKDGSPISIRIAVSEARVGRERFFVGMLHDLTEREALEAQLRHAQKMEVVGRLVSSVAHDFNNMLTVIRATTAVVDWSAGAEELREQTTEIDAAVDQATALTRQLLAFSRRSIEAPAPVHPREVLDRLGPLAKRLAGAGIEVTVACDVPARVRLRVDRAALEQAILNLVANARDAMSDGGKIRLSCAKAERDDDVGLPAGSWVRFQVSDDGRGMPPEVRARAFEPFFTTKPVGRGTGLGLATTADVVRRAGGRVKLESEPGEGTSISLYLAQYDEAPSPEVVAPADPRGNETVLLVEHDEPLRRALARALESFGYVVVEARAMGDALARIEARERSGERIHALVRELPLRASPADLPSRHHDFDVLYTVAVAPVAPVVSTEGATAKPSTALLQKPFSGRDLALRLRALLDARRS